jgi:hypothetical protein
MRRNPQRRPNYLRSMSIASTDPLRRVAASSALTACANPTPAALVADDRHSHVTIDPSCRPLPGLANQPSRAHALTLEPPLALPDSAQERCVVEP